MVNNKLRVGGAFAILAGLALVAAALLRIPIFISATPEVAQGGNPGAELPCRKLKG